MNDKTMRLLLQATKIMDIEQLELVRDLAKVTRINALEEAAMAAESLYDKEPSEDQDYGWNCACSRVAIAIRELKV